MKGEVDRQRGCAESRQLGCGRHPVVPVELHTPGQRKPGHDEQRGDDPTEDAQARLALADIMHDCGNHNVGLGPGSHDVEACLITVPLVGFGLGEEDISQIWSQPCLHGYPLGGIEGSVEEHVEEPAAQMSQ